MDNHNLPLDIISDVLLRLPIKSIGRFRCVSKPWRCLISESRFVKNQLHRSISSITDDNTRIVVCDLEKLMLANPSQLEPREDFFNALCKMVDSGLPSLGFGRCGVFLVGSCHGLVLLSVNGDDYTLANLFVFNPCTRDVRQLPKLINIANNKGALFCGIGYDSFSDDYKVLVDENVLSLKSNSWKRLTHIPFDYYDHKACGGVCGACGLFFGGSLYWITMCKTNAIHIVSFDLASEQYLEPPQLQLPPIPDTLYCQRLFVTGTYISLFLVEHYQDEHEVWELKEQGAESAWTKSYGVAYNYCNTSLSLVCLLKSGELLLLADQYLLVLYNPKDGTNRKFFPLTGDYVISDVSGYTESLVSPYRVHETGLGEQ